MIAFLLSGSSRHSAAYTFPVIVKRDPGAVALNREGSRAYNAGRYENARDLFILAAALADSAGDARSAAMNRSNAGSCELTTNRFGAALQHFREARQIAESAGEIYPLLFALNNLANLYVKTGQSANALQVAREALDGPAGHADEGMRTWLLYQIATSSFNLKKFDQAAVYYRQAVNRFMELNRFADAASVLGMWGLDNLRISRDEEAERALSEGLVVMQTHGIDVSASILTSFGVLRGRQNKPLEAARFFDAALAVKNDKTPRWRIFADRGQFRLGLGDDEGALADFREASRIAARIRLDMVPADQDRVAFESGIEQFLRGLVEAGNRFAIRTGSDSVLADTFNAAEQTRLWSLRSLLPSANDWRSHLSPSYWEKLSRYQTLERKQIADPSAPALEVASLRLELQQLEAEAGAQSRAGSAEGPVSTLRQVRSLLDRDTVLFSFHISAESSWLWVVETGGAKVFRLPPAAELSRMTENFTANALNAAAGKALYAALFRKVPAAQLNHSKWLLELDGPLHDVPFAALVTGERGGAPVFLVERSSLQIIPSSVLLERRPFRAGGGFLGVGDAVYNAADARIRMNGPKPEFSLPRLPGTSRELEACSRAWSGVETTLLTGPEAASPGLEKAAAKSPAIIHFATHIVAGTGEFRSGLIALSLRDSGAMDLLGPREILAHPTRAALVVMNGCHSGQGDTVSSSGRMGLTRAWIGAGADSVLATIWDIPDDESQSFMAAFYRALRQSPEKGVANALRESQLEALRENRNKTARWAGHYVLSRAL